MADSLSDGRTAVWVVPSIANIAAPTTTEINAGINISGLLTQDGLNGFQPDTAEVDTSKLNSTYGTKLPGRVSLSNTFLRLVKQTGTDTTYNTLVYGYAGYVVIRRDLTSSTAVATTQAVEVYPGQAGEVRNLDPAPNEIRKYEVPWMVSPQPNLRATVA